MLFNSIDFAIFLPLVFCLYWLVGRFGLKFQTWLLLIASYIFYGWWDWRFLLLLAFSSILDFFVGRFLHKEENNRKRKIFFMVSMMANLIFLGFFKYYNFFADSFAGAFSFLGQDITVKRLNIILPVGISFYTFQSMSYAFDIYRRQLEPVKDIVPFMTFVAFFPHMVAGPIQRASFFLPQFLVPKKFSYELATKGLKLMLLGFFMKLVVADRVGLYVDAVYENVYMHSGWSYVVATVFFAFEIYADFAGYSLIAIGCALLFGFYMSSNFNRPYFAASLNEFWRRWHISLSTWFRDYLYIPLGGNKGGKLRTYFNLFATFVISGLWHGANWTFVVWGAIHGSFQIIEKQFKQAKFLKVPGIVSILMVFTITSFAWIFFRANNIHEASHIVTSIITNTGTGLYIGDIGIFAFSVFAILALISAELVMEYYPNVSLLNHRLAYVRYATIILIVVLIMSLGVFDGSQFIYFQF